MIIIILYYKESRFFSFNEYENHVRFRHRICIYFFDGLLYNTALFKYLLYLHRLLASCEERGELVDGDGEGVGRILLSAV